MASMPAAFLAAAALQILMASISSSAAVPMTGSPQLRATGTAATLSLARSLPPLRGGGVGDFFSPDFSRKADQDAGKNKFVETAPTAVTAQADTNAVAKNTAEAGVQVQKEAPKKKAPVKMPELRTAVSIKNPGEVAMELKQKKADADAKYDKIHEEAQKELVNKDPALPKKGMGMMSSVTRSDSYSVTRSDSYSALNEEALTVARGPSLQRGRSPEPEELILAPGKSKSQPKPIPKAAEKDMNEATKAFIQSSRETMAEMADSLDSLGVRADSLEAQDVAEDKEEKKEKEEKEIDVGEKKDGASKEEEEADAVVNIMEASKEAAVEAAADAVRKVDEVVLASEVGEEEAEGGEAAAVVDGEEEGEEATVFGLDGLEVPKKVKDPKAAAKALLKLFMGEKKRFNVVIASSEVSPYSKSGGLADVAAKLSIALSQLGHRVMTVSPSYRDYDGPVATGVTKDFELYGGNHPVHYTHQWVPTDLSETPNPIMGVDRVFVQNANAFERAGMYGDPHEYFDNLCRFSLLCWAAVEAPLMLPPDDPFGEEVIFIANDWQTALLPMILASHYRRWRVFEPARCLFTIHNMGYPGNFPNPQMYNYDIENPRDTPKWSFMDLGLADNLYYDVYKYIFPEELRGDKGVVDEGEACRLLKGAILMADRVVTVSPTYREEIMTTQGGWGMHEDCRARQDRLDGILNGIDTVEWDPETDPHIAAYFSPKNLTGKAVCKAALQEALGLNQDPNAPIVAFIGRLAPQKGIDVIEQSYHWLMGEGTGDTQLVMMGSGQAEYADFMRNAENQYKGRVCGYVGFSPEMEHAIIAGADILVMPSRYEPCGLPQMYAQRYGTIPIVHATGGLQDSVDQFAEKSEEAPSSGTGWKFGSCDPQALQWGLGSAIGVYKKEPEEWQDLLQRAMAKDFSWKGSAEKYVQLMEWASLDPPRHRPWQFQHD